MLSLVLLMLLASSMGDSGYLLNSNGATTNWGSTAQTVELLFPSGNSSGDVKVLYNSQLGYYYQIQSQLSNPLVQLQLTGLVSANCSGAEIGIQQSDIQDNVVLVNITGINQPLNESIHYKVETTMPSYIGFVVVPPKCKVSFTNINVIFTII